MSCNIDKLVKMKNSLQFLKDTLHKYKQFYETTQISGKLNIQKYKEMKMYYDNLSVSMHRNLKKRKDPPEIEQESLNNLHKAILQEEININNQINTIKELLKEDSYEFIDPVENAGYFMKKKSVVCDFKIELRNLIYRTAHRIQSIEEALVFKNINI